MKILAAIPSYGTKNLPHLRRVIAAYLAMPHEVDIVVFSDAPKELDPKVEVKVGLPYRNPMALPFAHKKLFAERLERYDLFVYNEDDTPVAEHNVRAFLEATAVLPPTEVAGFLRFERDEQGRRVITSIHGSFEWDPHSVHTVDGKLFARFTNDHSACFMLTKDQMRRAINSGGFLVDPYRNEYGLLETAATDPYTRCGFQRVIGLSQWEDFLLPHLANNYHERLGLPEERFREQVRAMEAIAQLRRPAWDATKVVSIPRHLAWRRGQYGPPSQALIDMFSNRERQRVLSIGTGAGYLEMELTRLGHEVWAIAANSVTSAWAEVNGVHVLYGLPGDVNGQLPGAETFDTVVIDERLYWERSPVTLLKWAKLQVRPGGRILVREPDLGRWHTWMRRLTRRKFHRDLGDFAHSGVWVTSRRNVMRWFREAGLESPRCTFESTLGQPPASHLVACTRGLYEGWMVFAVEKPVAQSAHLMVLGSGQPNGQSMAVSASRGD